MLDGGPCSRPISKRRQIPVECAGWHPYNTRRLRSAVTRIPIGLATSLNWPEGIGLAYRIVIVQLAAALAATLSMSLVAAEQAVATAIGSLVCIVPTAGFAVTATRCRRPGQVVLAGAFKPMVIVGLMVLAFILANPAPLGFLVGLVAVHLAYFAAPLLDERGGQAENRAQSREALRGEVEKRPRPGSARGCPS